MSNAPAPDWRDDIFAALKAAEIRQVGFGQCHRFTSLSELGTVFLFQDAAQTAKRGLHFGIR